MISLYVRESVQIVKIPKSLKIINLATGAVRLKWFLDEFDVERVDLVIVLDFFIWENEVERDLVALVHDGAVAGHHLADVKALHAELFGDGAETPAVGAQVEESVFDFGLFYMR